MYWIRPSKKYDPTPFSRIKRLWHRLSGCPITDETKPKRGRNGNVWIDCSCGLSWDIGETEYDGRG